MKKINLLPHRRDWWSSLSLFLVSLPLMAGIAVASKAPPEAGVVSAIIGAIFFGLFSSAPLAVVGPAAGLSVFISSVHFDYLPYATVLTGFFLLLLSPLNLHRIVFVFPRSVTKGMTAGIGLILIMKMIPHLMGNDLNIFSDIQFFQANGRNSLTEIFHSLQDIHLGALIISMMSFLGIYISSKFTKKASYAFIVVILGTCLNLLFLRFAPNLALTADHMLMINPFELKIFSLNSSTPSWNIILKLALVMTSVIVLEGLVSLEIINRLDRYHRKVNYGREIFLLGLGNILVGILGGLPIMPVLIRSTANIEFGAKTNRSVILLGFWLLIAVGVFNQFLRLIPMATVAAILFYIGLNLINIKQTAQLFKKDLEQILPFVVTVGAIFFIDFLWGIVSGLVIGLIFTLRSLTKRTMVLVDDGERYLLKFYKDVTLFARMELKEHLDSIPPEKELLIDGAGNVFVEREVEEWLLEYADECRSLGRRITFVKSKLAISKLFKDG